MKPHRLIGCLCALLLFSCYSTDKRIKPSSYKGIRWQLLRFEDTTQCFQKNDWLWIDAEFLTEADSVFWNSHHEGADKFIIQLKDTVSEPFFYPFYQASEQDSMLIIAPKEMVLKSIFNMHQVPFFLQKDSTIRCFVKIKKHLHSLNESIFETLEKDEVKMINDFLETHKPLYQKDSMGIVWLDPLPIPAYQHRPEVREATVAYSGYSLDGRVLDHCDSLGIHYKDTLQLIEGLNYVIKRLLVGQSAKIILPSRLAFGSRGSFNKTIPPFTPLLYEIKLLQIQ